MQKLHSIVWLLLLVNTVKGQSINLNTVNQLSPNFVFDTLLNYKNERIALADWKGKAVILDFWATYCLPCIADFPKLENFKKRFGDSLQVLLVATDGIEKANRIYEARKKANKPLELPCAVNRKAHDYFKVKSVSTYVWIDDQGYVKGITDYSQVTEKNVADFVSKKDVHLRQVEAKTWADYKRYLVTIANEMDSSNVVFNSSLTKYLKGLIGGHKLLNKGVGTKIDATNSMIIGLYMIAFGDSTGDVPYARVSNETAQPEKYIPPKGTDMQQWQLDNAFCYELTVPVSRQNDILKIMREDLNRMFGMNVYMEERVKKCLVLTAEKNAQLMADTSLPPKKSHNAGGVTLINYPFAKLFEIIGDRNQDKIVLDETGITGNITVDLVAQMNDIDALNAALKKYGLNLAYKDRPVKMMIFKDPVK
jgi:thiol-disulfide isomerase/thioredoxin